MKWFGYVMVLIIGSVLALPFLIVDKSRIVPPTQAVSASEAKTAETITRLFHKQLLGGASNVELSLTNDELAAVLKVASYSFPRLDLESRITSFGLSLVATAKLEVKGFTRYINVSCILTNGYHGADIESCKVGALRLPGTILLPILEYGLQTFVGRHSLAVWQQIMTNISFERNRLTVKNIDSVSIRPALQATIGEAQNFVAGSERVRKQDVEAYLKFLSAQSFSTKSLLAPINVLFTEVSRQTLNGDATRRQQQVSAAVWALTIHFGHTRFGRLLGIEGVIEQGPRRTLKGREDLALHFLFSAFLQLNGGTKTAFSIGEIKELIDSNAGGSGFSFSDVVADKAGLIFAEYLTSPGTDLQMASLTLAQADSEDVFMLDISARPDGISEQEFSRRYQSINSPEYKQIMQEISKDIRQLSLYRGF